MLVMVHHSCGARECCLCATCIAPYANVVGMAKCSHAVKIYTRVGTVNLELQCGLSLSLIFKDLKGVPLG